MVEHGAKIALVISLLFFAAGHSNYADYDTDYYYNEDYPEYYQYPTSLGNPDPGFGSASVTAGKDTVVVEEGDQTKLACKADLPIAICSFIAPDGKMYGPKTSAKDRRITYRRNRSKTRCAININPIEEGDSGTWRCNIKVITKDSHTRDGMAITDVTVAASTVTKDEEKWRGRVGGEAQLLCTSKLKIVHCSFVT